VTACCTVRHGEPCVWQVLLPLSSFPLVLTYRLVAADAGGADSAAVARRSAGHVTTTRIQPDRKRAQRRFTKYPRPRSAYCAILRSTTAATQAF
jgi:hypothetical protein